MNLFQNATRDLRRKLLLIFSGSSELAKVILMDLTKVYDIYVKKIWYLYKAVQNFVQLTQHLCMTFCFCLCVCFNVRNVI